MLGNILSIRFALPMLLVLVLFASSVGQAAQLTGVHPLLIEVFTSADLPVVGETAIHRQPDYREIKLQLYEIEGIQRIEADLSRDLTADPEAAKRVVLQRIQQLDEASRGRMQRVAIGLAKAMEYGIDRFPAIVFNGQAVVYGVADLPAALTHYQAWRTGSEP